MLPCPFCRKPVTETSESCPHCSLNLTGCSTLLGPVPLLNCGLTDVTETLSDSDRKSLKRAIIRFEKAFPKSHLNIALRHYDYQFNLSTQLFWLFNKSGLSPIESKGGKNQDILIGLDPSDGRLALTIGYGLEPFVTSEVIAEVLEKARPLLAEGKTAAALKKLITELTRKLAQLAEEAHLALGIR